MAVTPMLIKACAVHLDETAVRAESKNGYIKLKNDAKSGGDARRSCRLGGVEKRKWYVTRGVETGLGWGISCGRMGG